MARYKNIGVVEQTIAGVGVVKPGEVVEINDDTAELVDLTNFNNANFELVEKGSSYKTKKVDEEALEDK